MPDDELEKHLREYATLREIVHSHITTCADFRKAYFAILGVFFSGFVAVFGYTIHIIDVIRDEQANYSRTIVLLQKRADDVNFDVTNRLSVIVAANLQREAGLIDRIQQLKLDINTIRDDLKAHERSKENR